MKKVSIVILNWNTSSDTIECIESMERTRYNDYEIILVDSASKPEDFKKIEDFSKKRKKIKLFRLQRNLGFAGGCNFGAKKASGEYILFLNNDTIVEKGFVEGLLEPFSAEKNVGATSSKIYFYDNGKTNRLYHSGENYISLRGISIDRAMGKTDNWGYDKIKEEGMFSGTCFMVPRELFWELDGFCGYYFAYYEEGDLSWRMRSAGKRLLYAPKSVLYHKGSLSVRVNKKQSMQGVLSIRNKYLTFYRNLKLADFVVLFPVLFSYDIVKALVYMPATRGRSAVNFIKGFGKFVISTDRVDKPRLGRLSDLSW